MRQCKTKPVELFAKASGKGADHLSTHGIRTRIAKLRELRKEQRAADVDRIQASAMRNKDPKRFWGMLFTILWIIQLLYPFSLGEHDNVRCWMQGSNPIFDPQHVHHKMVRHYVVEIYKGVETRCWHRLWRANYRASAFRLISGLRSCLGTSISGFV